MLKVKDLVIQFKTDQGYYPAVAGIDFIVNAGEVVALVGESGCGKSVTAQAILKLLPEKQSVVNGEIFFLEQDILQMRTQEIQKVRGKKISMIFQEPISALNPIMTIGSQITEVIRQHEHVTEKEALARAEDLLHKVGIADPKSRLMQYPHEFSGGMRQRIMIAMAIACNPKLLIADEPTTALDVTVQAQILDLLKSLQEEFKMGVLLITHNLGIVAGYADRVLVMRKGRIVESNEVDSLFETPKHPYTKTLLDSVRRSL